MVLLKFVKFLNQKSSGGESSSSLLPDPNSSLRQIVPSSAIAKANEIVAPVLPSAANHVERGPYTKLTPAKSAEYRRLPVTVQVMHPPHRIKIKQIDDTLRGT